MVKIEDVKKYWNSRPCNIRHSDKPAGSKEYFEEVRARKFFVEPHIPGFAEHDKWWGKKILEIGCGIGTDSVEFARNGARVTVVELSDQSMALAKKRAEVYNVNSQIDFFNGNAEELDQILPPQKFDLIYSFGVIHHSVNPTRIIDQIKKYMGPQSELRIMVYNKLSWKVFWIVMKYGWGAFWRADKLIANYSEAQEGCPQTVTYTKKSVKRLLSDFEIIDIKIEHIFSYIISLYKQYHYKKVWYFRWMPEFIFKALENKIGWHLCMRATLR